MRFNAEGVSHKPYEKIVEKITEAREEALVRRLRGGTVYLRVEEMEYIMDTYSATTSKEKA